LEDDVATILVVDDDQKLLKMLHRTLAYEGFRIVTAADGEEALEQVRVHQPDLIVLDWLMPEVDGIEVIRRLRAENDKTLVLMLTARDAIENRVTGLETGADDYLVKPFAPVELVARVRALLRRSDAMSNTEPSAFADLYLDPGTRQVRRGDVDLTLTPTEFDLLVLFMHHPHQVLERAQIMSAVWGYDFGGDDNVLEVYVGYLRKKMESGDKARLIQTVRGVGYVLREA
jgi:two-component system, OmpR family, response regulator MprA